jgi:L-lactate dehydrogenase (cytochrome)
MVVSRSTINRKLPSISFMEKAARKRIPKFAFDYLQGGIGAEACLAGNRNALDSIQLAPRYLLQQPIQPKLNVTLFGQEFPLPFSPAPLGLSGLIWPNAMEKIVRATTHQGIPLGLSTFATSSVEDIGQIAGKLLWFQLYCTASDDIENDLIRRAEDTGCKTLIVTIDIPTATRREKDIANGLSVPPEISLSNIAQIAARPRWALETLRVGIPRFKSLLPYVPKGSSLGASTLFLKDMAEGHITVQKLKRIRDRWPHRLLVKGVLTIEDAKLCQDLGVDGIIVSNHGGRQLDAAPIPAEILPSIRRSVGAEMILIADGGARSGLDIARLIAVGADFVLLGRAFAYAVAAGGKKGVEHAIFILQEELKQTLAQIGCENIEELPEYIVRQDAYPSSKTNK